MEQQFPSDPQDLNPTPYVYRPQREREDRFEELSQRGGGRDYTDPQLFVRGEEGVSVSDTLADCVQSGWSTTQPCWRRR